MVRSVCYNSVLTESGSHFRTLLGNFWAQGPIFAISFCRTPNRVPKGKKISGKYLITQVNHSIGGGKYMCSMSCSKDSYKANVTKVDDYIVGKR